MSADPIPSSAPSSPARSVARLAARLARRLSEDGARHPGVAAAVLTCRGRRVLDQAEFAALLGVPVEQVRTLESGRRPATHVPRRLAALDDAVDWAAAGIATDEPTDPAARHPAAGAAPRSHVCAVVTMTTPHTWVGTSTAPRQRAGVRFGANMPP